MAETHKIAPGLVIAGRYRVVREIGRGAVGSVHLVQHLHTDEQFALKILHEAAAASPEKIARFRVEARAPARIDSDHVVRITDADVAPELGGAPFFVMEYLRGQDLGAELEACVKLHPREVVFYLRQAARALDKAHALGIVHRDLKPENLFLTEREDGVPLIKLVDFGIAKLTGDAASIAQIVSRTQTGRIFGTPLFMSPEQATGRVSQIGPATDVWALGLVAHKLLTGRDYFESNTIAELIGKIAYDPVQPPSKQGFDFGKAYDAWFMRCCAREPEQRYRGAGEAIAGLAEAVAVVEGDVLAESVMSLRRARVLAYRATDPLGDDEIAVSVASTLDPPVTGAPPPEVVAAATAATVSAPGLPQPASQPTSQPASQDKMVGSAGPMVLRTEDLVVASPRREALRSGAIFAVAVAVALLVGLGFGFFFLHPAPEASEEGEQVLPSAAPAAPTPRSATPAMAPVAPSVTAPATAGSTSVAPPASSAPRSGSTTRVRDPLRGRH